MEIRLGSGHVVAFDDSDFELLSKYKWYASDNGGGKIYVRANFMNGIYMHHLILPKKAGFECDHINGNTLDNRRYNLRYVTRHQNMWNAKSHKSTGYKGVSRNSSSSDSFIQKKPFRAYIRINGKLKHLGCFATEIEAALKYNEAALLHRGEFALLNVIQ